MPPDQELVLIRRLPIDPYNIGTELADQASLYLRAAELASSALAESKRLKAKVKHTTALTSIAIRQHPTDYGLVKATESAIDDAVNVTAAVLEVIEAQIVAEQLAADAVAIRDSYDERRTMLKAIVELVSGSQSSGMEAGVTFGEVKYAALREELDTFYKERIRGSTKPDAATPSVRRRTA